MATPSYATVINQINTFIVANGNNEITANVLNPILEIITDFANNHMGDLSTLTTDEIDTLVDAINSLKQNISDITDNSVQLYTGIGNPNDTPPPTYNYADFYMQLSPLDNEPIQLWQFNGFEWFAPDAATSWGEIEGSLADQTDLQSELDLKADVTDLEDYQLLSEKGEPNGYTPLDSGAKVPIEFLPDSVVGQVEYQGAWNASTNTPDVGDPTLVKGHYYVTSVAGTYLGISYEVGDWIISNGVVWQKVDNTDAVVSVFGRIGAIVANSSDYEDFYVALSDYTASDVLTKLLTVDGSGSGLDADLLDGLHATSFFRKDQENVFTGNAIRFNGGASQGLLTNTNAQRLLLGGGSAWSVSNGAYVILEGLDYGGAGSGGNIRLSLPSGKKVYLNTSLEAIGNIDAGKGTFAGTVTGAPATLSTELVTKGQLDAAVRPYKVYIALITQSGTSAPTATVLENTLGGTPVWTRDSAGIYDMTLAGAFTNNKTHILVNIGGNTDAVWASTRHLYAGRFGNDFIRVRNYVSGALADPIQFFIEIKVYP